MKDYTKFCKWCLVYMIDRSTQDDKKSKLQVEAIFSYPAQIEDNYTIRNKDIKRYIINVDDLEDFEKFYNHIQDIIVKYGPDKAVFHIKDLKLSSDKENQFRSILKLWNSEDFRSWRV